MDVFVVESSQDRHISADKFAFGIKLFALADGVEDAEIRLGIATTRTRPLPATVVSGQVKVVQVGGEILLAPAPIDAYDWW